MVAASGWGVRTEVLLSLPPPSAGAAALAQPLATSTRSAHYPRLKCTMPRLVVLA
jgi:hypothetical protein